MQSSAQLESSAVITAGLTLPELVSVPDIIRQNVEVHHAGQSTA